MNENKIIYPLPTTLSERNTADDQVHLVEMNPMDMVELILSKTTESIYSGSSTNSGIGRAFTLPCFSGTNARDERCESLVRSILGNQISTDNININTVRTVKLNTSGRGMCKSRQDKAEMFQQIMSRWLLQNWVSPFPDTESLHGLAMHLIQAQCVDFGENDVNTGNKSREEYHEGLMNMTIKKIETYLVNVRMRKWRKSIEDAFDMRRPAQYLLEDSIRLYKGKELRTLDGWKPDEVFAPHDRYSLPLKAWKRKKKTVKAAKKRNSTATGEDVPETVGGVTPKRTRVASPMELTAGDGLIELAKGIKIMTTSDKKASPMDVLVKVGGMGLSPVNVGLGVGPLEDEARRKMLKGTFFGSPDGE